MKNTHFALIITFLISNQLFSQIYAPEIKVQIMPGDNVGIKTDNPSIDADVHIRDSGTSLYIDNTSSTNWAYLKIKGSGSNFWDIGQYGDNDYLEFRPKGGSSNRIFLKQNGNLGIKTLPNSDADLHIRDSRAALYIDNTSSTNWAYLKIKGSGSNFWDIGQYGDNDYLEFRPKGGSSNRIQIYQNGTISATTYIAVSPPWADFVFNKDYKLATLEEVENYIKEKGHLKDIPSAKEVAKNGVNLGQIDSKLLQKIEELTLYTIQQEKKIKELEKENQKLKTLSDRLSKIEKLLLKSKK